MSEEEYENYIEELEDALKVCMKAMQTNLAKANYKDEVILFNAYQNAQVTLNKTKKD